MLTSVILISKLFTVQLICQYRPICSVLFCGCNIIAGTYNGLHRPIVFQLENVAIANALQLEAVRATPALCCFNYDAMPSVTSPNLSIAVL